MPPNQPSFPQPSAVQPFLHDSVSAIPGLNTAFGQQSYGYPNMPQAPGQNYPYPPPQMMGGPAIPNYGLNDLFTGHPSTQNRGAVGFQGNQPMQLMNGSTYTGMAVNALANLGMNLAAASGPGGEALANGLVPFQGASGMSRFEYLQARSRQQAADLIFKGEAGGDGLMAFNPDLAFMGKRGIGNHPMFQSALADVGGFKTQFLNAYSQMGTAFGGSVLDQGRGVAQFLSGLGAGTTNASGVGTDFGLTQGLTRNQLTQGISTAYQYGALGVTGSDIREISDLVSAGKGEQARKKSRRLAGDVAEVISLGKDVFGADASPDQIFRGIEELFGREGLSDAGSAANRLRQVEAAGNVLNLDSQSVAKYMQIMKQMTRNVGLIGESGTDASLSMMMRTEGAARFGDRNDVNVDEARFSQGSANEMTSNLLSMDAKEKNVLANIMNNVSKDSLAGLRMNVNGKAMTGSEVLQRINAGLSNENMTIEERKKFEAFMGGAADALVANRSQLGQALSYKLRERTAYYDATEEEMLAQARGDNSYNAWTAKSGININTINKVEQGYGKLAGDVKMGLDDRENLVIERAGGVRKFMEGIHERGGALALQGGGVEGLRKVVRESIRADVNADLDRRGITGKKARQQRLDAETAVATQAAIKSIGYMKRYAGETMDGMVDALAVYEAASYAGTSMEEMSAAMIAVDGFGRTAGGMIRDKSELPRRFLEAGLKELMTDDGSSPKERIARMLGDATTSDRVGAYSKVVSGEVGYKDKDGKLVTINDLQDEVSAIRKGTGKKGVKDRKVADAIENFWSRLGEDNPELAMELNSEKSAQGRRDAEGSQAAAEDGKNAAKPPAVDAMVALGEMVTGGQQKLIDVWDGLGKELTGLLAQIADNTSDGGPRAEKTG